MKTPNTQAIQDGVVAEFGDRVRVGAWLCRRIAGTLTWSQHAYTEVRIGGPDYQGNAVDIFPDNPAIGDQVEAFLWDTYGDMLRLVLWRVKNHFDHLHPEPWPIGILTPPCRGGDLYVKYKDGEVGRSFGSVPAPPPVPEPPPVPLPPSIMEDVLLPLTPKSSPQDIGRLQDLINETYYYPKGEPGLTITTPPKWGNGTSSAVVKWLVPKTADTNAEVLAGRYVNYNQFNGLVKDWVREITK